MSRAVSAKRSSMLPESADMTTTLKCWLEGIGESLEDFESADPAHAVAQASNTRFIRLNVRLEVQEPTILSEDLDEFDEEDDADEIDEEY
jgi:hypothetical protein